MSTRHTLLDISHYFPHQNVHENASIGHFTLLFSLKCPRERLYWTFHTTSLTKMSTRTLLLDISFYFHHQNVPENASIGHFILLPSLKCPRERFYWTCHTTFLTKMSTRTLLLDIPFDFPHQNVHENHSIGHFTLLFSLKCPREHFYWTFLTVSLTKMSMRHLLLDISLYY